MSGLNGINWNLASGDQSMRSFERGRAIGKEMADARDRREYRSALADLAIDAENPSALATVFQHDPQTGVRLMDRAEQSAFGRDMRVMLSPGSNTNALLGLVGGGAPPAAAHQAGAGYNALAGAVTPQASQQTAPAAMASETSPASPDAPPAASYGLSRLGEPTTKRDEAFLRMVQRDPIKALKIKSALRDNFVEQAKAESDFLGYAMAELSRAQDPASWTSALAAITPRALALGMDLSRAVPAEYPGPDGLRELMERAQPLKDQVDYMLREANIEADNARADRNTDSLIETREGRLDEYRRANEAREANTRRGQDLTDARGRRGQDVASSDRRRGQDLRKKPTATGPNGEKYEWNGSKWAPIK